MLRKRYVKKAYIMVPYCDKCGSKMIATGMCYCTFPEQFEYKCTNLQCNNIETFWAHENPGVIQYEFEEENNV